MPEEAIDRMITKSFAGADNVKLQTAEALEEAARKLRSADIKAGGEDIKNILHNVEHQVDHFREEIGTKYHDVEVEYHKQVEPVENLICEHPIPAVMVAVGFGFLVGMLICRARD